MVVLLLIFDVDVGCLLVCGLMIWVCIMVWIELLKWLFYIGVDDM